MDVAQREHRFKGELLRKARRRAGLTQRQLADKVGRSRNLIGAAETTDALSKAVAHACARALGLSPDALYEDILVGGAELTPAERQVVEIMRRDAALADHIMAFAMGAAVSANGLPRERQRRRDD